MRFILAGNPIEFAEGDDLLTAGIRAGVTPPGVLCGAGDCPNCLATVDGVSYVRMCRTPATSGAVCDPHHAHEYPPLPAERTAGHVESRLTSVDVAVIGAGRSGIAEAERLRSEGRTVAVFDDTAGDEVAGIYEGPELLVKTPGGMVRCEADEVVVATGVSEIHPVCPGNDLRGIFTRRMAARLLEAGIDLGRVAAVGDPPAGMEAVPGELVRFEGRDGVVTAAVTRTESGETSTPCDAVSVGIGTTPRDLVARMGAGWNVRTVGKVAEPTPLPPPPTNGLVCPCSGVEVSDLESVWERGFTELDLIKRATLAGTGTCQGTVCMPHVRSFMAARDVVTSASFTPRPLVRQLTMAETAAGFALPAFRKTGLDAEHRRLGAHMDRFGGWWRPWRYADPTEEYWAVRAGVSLGDVGTLGKFIVSGPDVVEFLERLYPTRIADLGPGRSRYVLNLAESGAVLDDGMVCRVDETRFILTFTSGGASFAEAWMRDWAATFGTRVHILDRTHAWGAINVTGPFAAELLARAGLGDPPTFMRHREATIAGVPCRVFRLSFTGEASFELHHPVDRSVELWQALMRLGADLGVKPHGLDVLFTLRLEKGHIIVGMDTEADSTPGRLGMEWAVKMDKPDFIGRSALQRTASIPIDKRNVGLVMDGPAPDEGAIIRSRTDYAGYVTSARFSPVLGHTVMLGWVNLDDNGDPPADLSIDGRPARVSPVPFYDPEGSRARA